MIVLDTTVLVYAMGTDHTLRGPCRQLIAAIAEGSIEATTTVEAIQEFVHVRARKRSREDAAKIGRDYVELLSPLLAVTAEQLREGLSLFERSDGIGAFDAVLAAAAAGAGATAIVSADAGFSEVGTIRHIVPDADGITGLLGGGGAV